MSSESGNALIIAIESGPGAGNEYRFDQKSVTVGRSSFNDVALPLDKTISEYHARLVREGADWVIQDLSSKNGVFLEWDGMFQRIQIQSPLNRKQRFRLGVTTLTVSQEEAAGRPSGAQADSAASQDNPEPCSPTTPAGGEEWSGSAPRKGMMLRIDREESALKFQLFSSGAYGARHGVAFCSEDVHGINERLGSLVTLANRHRQHMSDEVRAQVEHALREIGAFVGGHLFPRRVRKRLTGPRDEDLFLIHDASLVRLPWELALVDDEFLCRRFNLGRQIMVDDWGSGFFEERKGGPLRMLIVSNPTGDLPDVQEEAEALFDHLECLDERVEVDFLAGRRVERMDLLSRLSRTDVVFYVGHAEHDADDPANSGWILDRGRITCGDFRRLQSPPRLVFANGCETGKEASWSPEMSTHSHGYGIASGFILGGVQSYVGALWPIPADSATAFAVEFFSHLLAGAPIGRCVRLAREKTVRTFGLHEILWASYVLYGDPGSRVI